MYHKRSLDIEHIAGYTDSTIISLFFSPQTYNTVKIKHRKVHKIFDIYNFIASFRNAFLEQNIALKIT